MKKVLIGCVISELLLFSGCGTESEDINTSSVNGVEVKEVAIEKPNTKTFYDIEIGSHPLDGWELALTEDGVKIYYVDDSYFDTVYALTIDNKVVKVLMEKNFYNDDYGTSSMEAFTKFDNKLRGEYNLLNEFNKCFGSEFVCRYDNYSYSIYKGDRTNTNFYENGEDIIAIGISAINVYDLRLTVSYDSIEWTNHGKNINSDSMNKL